MKSSLVEKLVHIHARHQHLNTLLSDPNIVNDLDQFRALSKEYSNLTPLVEKFQAYQACDEALLQAEVLKQEDDLEMKALAEEEWQAAHAQKGILVDELLFLLIPPDPHDERNVFLELRGAAGGDESAIFAGDLFRMYQRYADIRGWSLEILEESAGDHGGYKSLVARISGQGVYARLKFESGAHRVQRVPATEAQGRIHTSTCTVAILPEVESIDKFDINPADLRIDTFRSSGAGGQHVNKTDSAIRITHIPTGTVVECQDERSQHKNRARAMSLLGARLLDAERAKAQAVQASERRNLVGTGDRSERIRTYNYPQGRLTDHRINLTLYSLTDILEGHLDPVIEPLLREHNSDVLQAFTAEAS